MATPADVMQELLTRVRKQLFDRGLVSCGTVLRACKRADWNGNGKLDKKEFEECLKSCGVFLSSQDVSALFRAFDITGDGNVTYDEFLTALKGELSPERLAMVEKAFARLDRDGSGVVTIDDITGVFNAKKHPEVMEGRKTEAQVLTEFLATMEGMCGDKDGKVTFKEFKDYYTELSASIPTDTYFVTMMESAWMIRSSNTPEDEKKLDGIEELIRDKMVERTHGTETEAHALERIFRFFDTDATGSLTLDEFGRALLQIGIPIERRWVSGLFDRYDTDKSGALSYREFSTRVFRTAAASSGTSIL